jgi:hypothetical protein
MRLEHETQRTPLPVERRKELCTAVGRRQHAVDESLQRPVVRIGGRRLIETRLEVPTCTMVVAQSRARGSRVVLSARRAQRDVTQQIRTGNKGHLVFLEHLSQVVDQFRVTRGGADQTEPLVRMGLNAHRGASTARRLVASCYSSKTSPSVMCANVRLRRI